MLFLLEVIQENGSLQSLNLGYNQLLKAQTEVLTPHEIEEGATEVELSDFNLSVVSCFKDFIKYNCYL